jgi:hypothetical protein
MCRRHNTEQHTLETNLATTRSTRLVANLATSTTYTQHRTRERARVTGQKPLTLRPSNRLPGDHSVVEPPDPIPNSEVKRNRADGSVAQAMQE